VRVVSLHLPDLLLVTPRVLRDHRGFFLETYQQERYVAAGISATFVQDNHARSTAGTLRGLHYQSTPGQAKLVRAAVGRIFDVAVDLRPDSPTFGRWAGVELDAESHEQLYVPLGFAHGYCVLSDVADVEYKVTSFYDPATEGSIRWDDPDLGIPWPVSRPTLSPRDEQAESFATFRARVRR
jgi:dTDP-4-dehydrorhamnose 3,5-epimerase